MKRMRHLVDVHAHYVPDFYRRALIDSGNETPDGSPIPAWDEETHLARLKELHLDAAVLSLSSPGVSGLPHPEQMARRVNEYGRDVARRHSNSFAYLACLPLPDVTASRVEAEWALTEGGAAGIGLLTNYNGTYLGAPDFEPLLESLNAHGATVVIHPTSPRGAEHLTSGRPSPVIEYLFETTRAVTNLLLTGAVARYPRIQWVVLHNGAAIPSVIDRVAMFAEVLLGADVEPLAQLRSMVFEIGSSAPFPRTAQSIADLVGSEQLVLGTDTPYAPPPVVTDSVSRILAGDLDHVADIGRISSTTARLFPTLA